MPEEQNENSKITSLNPLIKVRKLFDMIENKNHYVSGFYM